MRLVASAPTVRTRWIRRIPLPHIEDATDPPAHVSGRLRSLDVLRAIAVIGVIVHHWGQGQSGQIAGLLDRTGWAGVDLFFVLSGFPRSPGSSSASSSATAASEQATSWSAED